MNVLIACEFSGIVREAFRSLGHHAVSVDLLPSEIPGSHCAGGDMLRPHPDCKKQCYQCARPQTRVWRRTSYGGVKVK